MNTYFEFALFRYLYSSYNLAHAETQLNDQGIAYLLQSTTPYSTISKYFRFMNRIDYTKLSFFDRKYISKHLADAAGVEKNWNQKKAIKVYTKVLNSIRSRPKGYTLYHYDGTFVENPNTDSIAFNHLINHLAPNKYITFGIYYVKFDEHTNDGDVFRNQNIVTKIANQLQEKNIAIVTFSEVDQLSRHIVSI